MEPLSKKIDFAVIITVKKANPNGDPLTGNRPRVDFDGYGEISDVCIKRKLRNHLMEMGQPIFVQSDDNRSDEYRSLSERLKGELKEIYQNMREKSKTNKKEGKDNEKKNKNSDIVFREAVCKKWFDVRAFGQVFPYKGEKGKSESISIGIRGPVSVHPAFSVATVSDRITSQQITKSVNLDIPGPEKAPDTMGMKHRVDHGVYVFYGSINPQLAALPSGTGFSDQDADAIKESLSKLFRNDASSARPEGSMEVHKVYWWKHNNKNGQYSSAEVHRSMKVQIKKDVTEPKDINHYDIVFQKLSELNCEIIDGL